MSPLEESAKALAGLALKYVRAPSGGPIDPLLDADIALEAAALAVLHALAGDQRRRQS